MANQNRFNDEWALEQMLAFSRNVFGETEVLCQWTDQGRLCNDLVKAKNFKAHLYHRHGVVSDSQSYQCRWDSCSSLPMKKSSLERHTVEQHVPFRWPCPCCIQTFTRESSLLSHIERSPDHPQLPL